MRACRAIAIAAACSLASCSLVTSWDGLTGSQNTGGAASSSNSGSSSSSSKSTSTSHSSSTGMQCVSPGLYCGGDKLMGDPNTLFQCNPNGSGTLVQQCMYGCDREPPGSDDRCHCQPGGYYCGGDKLDGNASTLYQCNMGPNSPPIFVMVCPTKCNKNAGADDTCT